jgi:hypothetical protein
MLSRIFGQKKADVREARRKLHDEKLHNLYSLNTVRMIKSRRMCWVRRVAPIRVNIYAWTSLVGNPEGKNPAGTPKRRRKDNIKMDL